MIMGILSYIKKISIHTCLSEQQKRKTLMQCEIQTKRNCLFTIICEKKDGCRGCSKYCFRCLKNLS